MPGDSPPEQSPPPAPPRDALDALDARIDLLDRYRLVLDVIDRVPLSGSREPARGLRHAGALGPGPGPALRSP